MSFPEINRVFIPRDEFHETVLEKGYKKEVIDERRSRAKWARALAGLLKLGRELPLQYACYRVECGLLRQAEVDEK